MLCMVELLCHSFQVKQVEKHNDYKIRCLPEDSAHVFISHIGRNGQVERTIQQDKQNPPLYGRSWRENAENT